MIRFSTMLALLAGLALSVAGQGVPRTFTSSEGQAITDRLVKYDWEKKAAILEKSGRIQLEKFSPEDQAYILRWNQVEGFKSTMRFKMEVEKNNWARMKHEQTITPYIMDAVQIPGKATPSHFIVMVDDYEEYNAVYLEAEGFTIKLRNQNFFPIENLVVESKVFYEQENYVIADSLFTSDDRTYTDTVTTNKVKFLSETVPVIVPREEVAIDSESAVIVDQQISRNTLVTVSEEESDDSGDDEGEEDDEAAEEEAEVVEVIEGFGEWDDHARRRKGKIEGVWFRVGIEDTEGNMVWREVSLPNSVMTKFSWETPTGKKKPGA